MKRFSLILALVVFTVGMAGCNKANTKKVLSKNVSTQIKEEVSEVNELLSEGEKSLAASDYVNAKIYYDKAIELDKSNKDIYLQIKDQYLSKERYEDAYYIVKKAIDNKIDEQNMNNILNDIKSHFNIIELSDEVYVDGYYELPGSTEVNIDGQVITMNINWNNQTPDSSTAGTYKYEGYNDQYGRSFLFTLNVKEKEQEQQKVQQENTQENTAAQSSKDISELDIKNLIISGVNTFSYIVGKENVNSSNTISRDVDDGFTYAECTKYTTAESIAAELKPYYTDECINRFIDKHIIMKDGKAYVTLGDIGDIVNSDYTYTINYGADSIAVNANYNYEDYAINRDYELVYTDNGWRMNKISEIEL